MFVIPVSMQYSSSGFFDAYLAVFTDSKEVEQLDK